MGIFSGIQHAFIVLIFVFDLGRNELYPSIQWTPLNPIFRSNKTQCVHPMSKLIFVCPNTATTVTKLASSNVLRPLYENLWLVSRQSYERCELNQTTDSELILCDDPFNLKYYTVIFKKYSASVDPKFEPGKDYYFVATSNGEKSSIKSTSGGRCKTQNMKLKFHICTGSGDPRCQSDEMCNGIAPTTQAPTTIKPKSTSSRSCGNLPTTGMNDQDKRCNPHTKKSSPTEVPKQEETVSPPISFVKCNNTDGTDVTSKFCNNTACGTNKTEILEKSQTFLVLVAISGSVAVLSVSLNTFLLCQKCTQELRQRTERASF